MVYSKRLDSEMLIRWHKAAKVADVQPNAYDTQAREIRDESYANPFSFCVFYNAARLSRPIMPILNGSVECRMCSEKYYLIKNAERNLDPYNELPDFVVTINKFPTVEGSALAIAKQDEEGNHRAMYNSSNLGDFVRDVESLLPFARKYGFELYHQTAGAGATMSLHEHWHLTNWQRLYQDAGKPLGFDAAEMQNLPNSNGLAKMVGFPFAHLVFTDEDTERMAYFIRNLDKNLGKNYSSASIPYAVPHTFSSGQAGILVAPFKCDVGRRMGSESPAGIWLATDTAAFANADYNTCLARLNDTMYLDEELPLEKFA
jgi:hypothetical protein